MSFVFTGLRRAAANLGYTPFNKSTSFCNYTKIAFLSCSARNFMPNVYSDVDNLENQPKVGSKQCVALLQTYVKTIPMTSSWQQG
jgi:hypothetical protein